MELQPKIRAFDQQWFTGSGINPKIENFSSYPHPGTDQKSEGSFELGNKMNDGHHIHQKFILK